jgi:hypothetical protein
MTVFVPFHFLFHVVCSPIDWLVMRSCLLVPWDVSVNCHLRTYMQHTFQTHSSVVARPGTDVSLYNLSDERGAAWHRCEKALPDGHAPLHPPIPGPASALGPVSVMSEPFEAHPRKCYYIFLPCLRCADTLPGVCEDGSCFSPIPDSGWSRLLGIHFGSRSQANPPAFGQRGPSQ